MINSGQYNLPSKIITPPTIIIDTGVPVISALKQGTSAAIYGIGISAAVARARAQALKDRSDNYTIDTTGYSPDINSPDRWDGRMSQSLTGMPVMCALKFVGGNYLDLEGNLVTVPNVIFETVVLSLTLKKNIKATNITGRPTGSVKEYIGIGDWGVEIRAIITSDAPVNENIQRRHQDGVYPRDNMAAIWQVLRAPIAIPVECWYLNQFDINYLVVDIDGTTIQQIEGEYSMQRLVIQCLSDNPLVIKIANQ